MRNIIYVILFLIPFGLTAQKKTHDHEKFVKKVSMAMAPALIVRWMPDDEAILYLAKLTGDPVDELKAEVAKITEQVQSDAQFINENGIYPNTYKSISVNVKQSDPFKIADLVLHCEFKGDVYDITLQNCVQTDQSWYLGDAILPSGEGVKDAVAKMEARKNQGNSGLLGKLNDMAEESGQAESQENANTNKEIYEAKRFPMKGTDASSQFIQHELIGQTLDGYYIDQNYNKVEAKIKYEAPEIMSDPNKYLQAASNGEKGISKSELKAFFVGGQMYVFTGEYWDILVKEGAIRRLARVVKNESTGNYVLGELVQKLELGPENTASLGLGFKNKMAELVQDNTAMADRVMGKEEGYKFKDLEKITDEYNAWFDAQYPGKVVYLLEKINSDDSQDIEESAEGVNKVEEMVDYSSWSDLEIKQEFETAIMKGMIGVLLDMINTDDRVSANHGTAGGKAPLLLAAEHCQYKVAFMLIQKGADVNVKDNKGYNALMLILSPMDIPGADLWQPELFQALVDAGLDINAQDNKGQTALHYFANMNPHEGMVQEFIAMFQPDKTIQNKEGLTPYEVSIENSTNVELHKVLQP